MLKTPSSPPLAPAITIKELRERLKAWPGIVNPYDLLQIAMEYLANLELAPGSFYVSVDEFDEGFQAWAGYRHDSLERMTSEIRALEIRILQDPDDWRLSQRYRQWRQRLTEGFER